MKPSKRMIYRFLPVKKGRFLFSSYDGLYRDSPRLLSEYIHSVNPSIEIAWRIKKENVELLPDYVVPVIIGTSMEDRYLISSEVCIDNYFGKNNLCVLYGDGIYSKLRYSFEKFFKNKRSQHLYTTWHGSPIKKIGKDEPNSLIIEEVILNTTFILGDKYIEKVMNSLFKNEIDVRLLGSPRNDVLLSSDTYRSALKEKMHIPIDKHVILYAPTFRGDTTNSDVERSGLNQIDDIDINRLLSALHDKFGDDWVFIARFHQFVSDKIDWDYISTQHKGRVINGNLFGEMGDYLAVADVLLTDISSCIFDFAITKKPVFLYFPDFEYYLNNERELYIDIDDLPFPCGDSFDELIGLIEDFNQYKYEKNVNEFLEIIEPIISNSCTKMVSDFILDETNNRIWRGIKWL